MERRSLFAVVDNFENTRPPYYSILQLDPEECSPEQMRMIKVDEKVRLNVTKEPHSISYITWLFSPPKGSSEDLYMVPNWRFSQGDDVKPLHGYKFNFSAGSFVPINLPEYYKDDAFVVSLRGKIYLISDYDCYSKRPTDFQCYDPVKDSWKPLEPFPSQAVHSDRVATAVWNDTILLIGGHASIWAYDVEGNKWYRVEVEGPRCKVIVGNIVRGEAIVLGNTIYALTDWSVVVLSISKESIGNCFVFKCSLLSDNQMEPILFGDDEADEPSSHLVHLGKDKFCVVQSCHLFGSDRQPIKVTYIKFKKDKSVMVIDEYFQWVKIQRYEDEFCIRLCFSLPKGAATALKQGKKSFILHPFPEAVEEEDSFPEAVEEEDSFTEAVQEEDSFTEAAQEEDSFPEAVQEEEDEDNDASQTNIIDEQLGGCNRTQAVGSSSFGKNKLKKPPRSKTTRAGHNGGCVFFQPRRQKKKRPNKVADLESRVSGLRKDLKEEKELLKNVLTKMKERLYFLEEECNKARQDAEKSNKQVLEMSSKLEEEAIDKDEKKQASDQPKSEGTAVLEEDHVSLFESELEELKIQKSVESGIILDCVRQLTKEVKLQLEVVAESEAAQKNQAELAKSELNTLKKEMEAELKRLNGQLEQWNKFAVVHSTGNNGNFLNRSLSMDSKYSPGDDDLIRKKNRNVLKKLRISWKKPQKSVLQNTGIMI